MKLFFVLSFIFIQYGPSLIKPIIDPFPLSQNQKYKYNKEEIKNHLTQYLLAPEALLILVFIEGLARKGYYIEL